MQLPPRDVASLLIVRAITRAGWAMAGVLLVVTMIMVVDVGLAWGQVSLALSLVALLAAQLAVLLLMYARPRWSTGIAFIVVGACVVVCYQYLLFTGHPDLVDNAQFLLNRPIVAMVVIGAISATPIGGIQWSTAALLAGELASTLLQISLGREVALGTGPLIAYAAVILVMLWLQRGASEQMSHVPDLATIDTETIRLEREQEALARAAAVIHDTVLSDLAAIAHGRTALPDNEREHLRAHLHRLTAVMAEPDGVAVAQVDDELLQLVSDMQWEGLSVELSGLGTVNSLGEHQRGIALTAIRESLHTVLADASQSADLFIDENPDEVMIMISGQGPQGDRPAPATQSAPRVMNDIERAGGKFSVWRQPDVGTSIVFSLPKAWERQR